MEIYPWDDEGALGTEPEASIPKGLQTAARGLTAGKIMSHPKAIDIFGKAYLASQGLLKNLETNPLDQNPLSANQMALHLATSVVGTPLYIGGLNIGMSDSASELAENLSMKKLLGTGVPAGVEFFNNSSVLSPFIGMRPAIKTYGNYLTGKSIGKRALGGEYPWSNYELPPEEDRVILNP